jgi:hypothetical protein
MLRNEPPPRATWILEHLVSGERDEAIAGDLLEEFRSGRSGGWYRQQVLLACAISWSRSLSARVPVLFFALLWSILAPAWYVLIEKAEHQFASQPIFDMSTPFSMAMACIAWIVLHAAFLWAGLIVYRYTYGLLGTNLRQGDMRRAFWRATLILPPVYFVIFVIACLYRFAVPALAHMHLAASSLDQVADFGIFPDVIRIPYFVALLCALWGTVHPFLLRQACAPGETAPEDASMFSHSIFGLTGQAIPSAARFLAWMVAAGLINASIAAILLCVLPVSETPAPGSLLMRALCYIAAGVAAGAVGAYAYWQGPWSPFRDRSPVPFSLFVLVCSSGWIWIPATVIFFRAFSTAGAFAAMIGAYVLAGALRSATYAVLGPATAPSGSAAHNPPELFEESLYRPPADLTGYTIAILLIAAGAALAVRWNLGAGGLLAFAAALFAWKKTIPRERTWQGSRAYLRASARIALLLVPAIVVTAWALLDGAAHQHGIVRPGEAHGAPASSGPARASKMRTISYGSGGYVSVILWPSLPKKQILPPVPSSDRILAPGSREPFIIHFDGAYTYVQPPDRQPGPGAHRAHGTPLEVAIESNNALPVIMTAHQSLPAAIPASRCREIDVRIENRDNIQGRVSMALLLTGSRSTKSNGFYLGQQPILSMEPMFFSIKTSPVTETLRFSVSQNLPFRSFTGITFLFLPDIAHHFVAPRIAIEQLQFLPR